MLFGGVFLGVKAFEWKEKFDEHHVPGPGFHLEGEAPQTRGSAAFLLLYFAMTGLHALHMVIGVGLLLYPILRRGRGKFSADTGLRWTSPAFTGTLSTSSGFSCSRCCI